MYAAPAWHTLCKLPDPFSNAQVIRMNVAKVHCRQHILLGRNSLPQGCGCFCAQGPWMENHFYTHFVANPNLNAKLMRVYIPICFTDAVLAGKTAAVSQALQVRPR
jgi:hypothetical protein